VDVGLAPGAPELLAAEQVDDHVGGGVEAYKLNSIKMYLLQLQKATSLRGWQFIY